MIPATIIRQVADNLAQRQVVWRLWRCQSTMRRKRLTRMRESGPRR